MKKYLVILVVAILVVAALFLLRTPASEDAEGGEVALIHPGMFKADILDAPGEKVILEEDGSVVVEESVDWVTPSDFEGLSEISDHELLDNGIVVSR
ncbi:hypothetical protein HOG48_03150 [Candidatus Peregrinibacteria bacterium]|jgi:hypothetical protein|nr:hypothetical protein [Candidatus Peregrinibacteria bacterium]